MPENLPQQLNSHQKQKAPIWSGLFASKAILNRLSSIGIDLIFPPRCAGCGHIDTHWCADCQRDLDLLTFTERIEPKVPLEAVAASGWHMDKLREAVQALKYENAREVARPLGEKLARCLSQQNWTIDMIAPVPLHTKRLAERGYNQAQLLAEVVADIHNIRCEAHALERVRETQSQVTVSGAERLVNIKGAFTANKTLIDNQCVLIVDDVYTTGSTLSACGEALILAGARAVYGLTVSVAGYSITHKKEIVDEYHH
ncbi:MAG: ComF family protein [Anaerolineaceae bacterium]|nr:ComF family protein [Anaerolineaceae bacterium]